MAPRVLAFSGTTTIGIASSIKCPECRTMSQQGPLCASVTFRPLTGWCKSRWTNRWT